MVDYKYKDIYNDTSVSKKMQIEDKESTKILNQQIKTKTTNQRYQ